MKSALASWGPDIWVILGPVLRILCALAFTIMVLIVVKLSAVIATLAIHSQIKRYLENLGDGEVRGERGRGQPG